MGKRRQASEMAPNENTKRDAKKYKIVDKKTRILFKNKIFWPEKKRQAEIIKNQKKIQHSNTRPDRGTIRGGGGS